MEQMIQKEMRLPDGGRIVVDVYADRPHTRASARTLVVLPGVMSDSHAWRRFAAALRSWPVVAVINRRGRPPSTPLPSPHSIAAEVADLHAVLDEFGARQVFAWSFGGLVALHSANERSLDHLIAYEPVMAPFGAPALPSLERAHAAADWDASVEIVNRDISGFDDEHIARLRADPRAWERLRTLARPLSPEVLAIGTAPVPEEFAQRAERIDVIVGGDNLGEAPYGTTVDDVLARTPRSRVHTLPSQGHMAHLEDPDGLAALVDRLA